MEQPEHAEQAPVPTARPWWRRRLVAAGLGVVALAGAAGVVAAATSEDKQTPCAAATMIVKGFRDDPPATVGYAEAHGQGYANMLRGLITGDYEDVDGVASPALAGHLRAVADDLTRAGALYTTLPDDEFTAGQTGRHIDALLAYCATAER